jgi:hypothetical protein
MGVKYCEYHNCEWIDKYNGLTYSNLKTVIEGNTFYIKVKTEDTRKLHDRIRNNPPFVEWKTVVMLIMCTMKEETINDVLRSYNFHCKYDWLKEEVKGE